MHSSSCDAPIVMWRRCRRGPPAPSVPARCGPLGRSLDLHTSLEEAIALSANNIPAVPMAYPEDPAELGPTPVEFLDASLRSAVDRLQEPLRGLAYHHFGWETVDGEKAVPSTVRRRGATLTLLMAGADPVRQWSVVRNAAVATTVLLNSYVVFDDIADGDRVRRGVPTVWARHGVPAALQLGTALQALAFELLAAEPPAIAIEAVEHAADITQTVCSGQVSDAMWESQPGITLEQSLDMYRRLAGGCAQLACVLGSVCSGGDAARTRSAAALGVGAGTVFAVHGAVAEVWGGSDRSSKRRMSDLRQRKKTPLVAVALERLSGTSRAELTTLFDSAPIGDSEVTRIVQLLDQAGVRDWARRYLADRLAELDTVVPHAVPDPRAQQLMRRYLSNFHWSEE